MGNILSEDEKKLFPLIEQGKSYVTKMNDYQENSVYIFKYREIFYHFDDGGKTAPEFEVIGPSLDIGWKRTMLSYTLDGKIYPVDIEKKVDDMIKNAANGKKRGSIFYVSDDEIYIQLCDWKRYKFGDYEVSIEIFRNDDVCEYTDLTKEDWERLKKLDCTMLNHIYGVPFEVDIKKLEKEIRIKFFEGEIPDWEDKYYYFSEDLVIVNKGEFQIDEVRDHLINLAKKTNFEIPYRPITKKEWRRLKKFGHSESDIEW